MRKRINLILIAALLFGLVAAWGTYQYLRQLENTYKASGQFLPVAVARVNIPARQVISEQMVEFTQMPSNYANPASLGKPEDVVGKITRSDIYAGEQVLKNNIANSNDPGEGLAMTVEPGRRGMTVAINDITGVAGLLRPGDQVDVLGTFLVENQTITSLVVQNIRVLAVNKSTSSVSDNKPAQTGTLTLSLSPVEAQQLTLAAEKGNIRVLLRTPADKDPVNVPSTYINHLVR
ncbi:MAG: pilus assembly protein CpaB [Peptococcaceae bacterium BICA1-7]|nr:MAG: pilus assembly protein CpaB [Peptococcaceae bacterium BICA1-7]HBV98143.1 Flp pilus assembly protein CpaB [Desulfotomaculum sp.]